MASANQEYIQPASNDAGIYFDPIGTLKITDDTLDIIIPIDISFVQPHLENIKDILGTSKFLCKQSNVYYESECHYIFQPLSSRYSDIVRDFNSISYLISKKHKRTAWFSGIGTVIKQLFGNMDENDAIKYNDAIKTIEDDQTKLATLMKENMMVTTSTMSAFKEIIDKINSNEINLNHAIETLNKDIQNLTYITDKLFLRSKISGLSNILESSLLTLSFKLEDIINAIMFSKSNILYPSIITPEQLFSDLVNNYRFLPSSKHLPIPLVLENIHILENVSDVFSYYANEHIIFVLQIPLVNTEEFDLYHTIPYPVIIDPLNNTLYSTIVPSTKYLGITKDKASYCKSSSLSNCKTMNTQYYICEMSNVYSTSASPICETEVISKALSSVPLLCKTKFVNGNFETFHKLHNNKWIYIMSQKTKLTIECHNQDLFESSISGTGILTLPSECVAYCKENKLIPKRNLEIKVKPVVLHFELINDTCCSPTAYLKDNFKAPFVELKNIDNLDSLLSDYNRVTDHIKTDLNAIIDKPHIVLYGSYYSYTTIIIVLIILIIVFYKLYCYYKSYKTSKCNPNPEIALETISSDPEPIEIPAPRLRMT